MAIAVSDVQRWEKNAEKRAAAAAVAIDESSSVKNTGSHDGKEEDDIKMENRETDNADKTRTCTSISSCRSVDSSTITKLTKEDDNFIDDMSSGKNEENGKTSGSTTNLEVDIAEDITNNVTRNRVILFVFSYR